MCVAASTYFSSAPNDRVDFEQSLSPCPVTQAEPSITKPSSFVKVHSVFRSDSSFRQSHQD